MTQVACPGCGAKYRVRAEFAGLRFRCKHCGARFVSPGQPAKVSELPDWLRLREIDPTMIAQVVDDMRQKDNPRKAGVKKKLTAAELHWQRLIEEMYGEATGPQRT